MHFVLVKRCNILPCLIGALKESCVHTTQNGVEHQVGRVTSSRYPTLSYQLSSQHNAVGSQETKTLLFRTWNSILNQTFRLICTAKDHSLKKVSKRYGSQNPCLLSKQVHAIFKKNAPTTTEANAIYSTNYASSNAPVCAAFCSFRGFMFSACCLLVLTKGEGPTRLGARPLFSTILRVRSRKLVLVLSFFLNHQHRQSSSHSFNETRKLGFLKCVYSRVFSKTRRNHVPTAPW